MNVLERKISEVQHLVQDENYGYKEAVDKVKYDIDGDELYDMRTGQTICQDITTATDEQVRDLLQIKKALCQRTKRNL
ncbi:hypothetical protein [Clostridium ljungdahlii]|uniref:Uncharacterized protein n=1 Tax=Clostridium ljungdahlii (strain ATCC 55383 / DSM 13528 / PETC) TaxID=748727 RepID=D8GQQ8_CLOLD|nr:hypothetical protein [Clostridium ljungdahlii]ADK16213.1 hypothetical protein CLJU_c31650 [Clostridium ljungdahlii DSM 13528]OAA89917.1 hypothetical protein WX45_01756 [Clostridium ljungdahlii DSM 13528]